MLPDGTFVPAGTAIQYHPYVMGHIEELWPEPLKVCDSNSQCDVIADCECAGEARAVD